jgi:hypothetical protein
MVVRSSEAVVAQHELPRSAASAACTVASLSTLMGTSFLLSYLVFHALHVCGWEPRLLTLLSSVPLFATCGNAALAAAAAGSLAALADLDHPQLLARMPKVLAAAIALFVLEIVVLA